MAYTDTFIEWADEKMLDDKCSPDIVADFFKRLGLFDSSMIPSTITLYGWID
ncbi:hypothetical protein ADIAL_1230 [Alkalibacterium sp. AK22]|nr:hypothetical protein ADIAL_1230 [Alkalibacterium sp. AK22]